MQELEIIVTDQGNTAVVPVRCYQQDSRNIHVVFIPKSTGPHKIEILLNGDICQVYDPTRVVVVVARGRSKFSKCCRESQLSAFAETAESTLRMCRVWLLRPLRVLSACAECDC